MTRLLCELLKQIVDAILFPLDRAVHPLDSGEAPEEATGIDDLHIVVERGIKVNDVLGLDIKKAKVEGIRRAEEIGIYAVVGHVQCCVQDGVGIHLSVPNTTDHFGVRGDLGEFIDEFACFHDDALWVRLPVKPAMTE